MSRQEFIEKCKTNLDIKEAFFYLDVDVRDYSDKEEFQKELLNNLNPILSILNIDKKEIARFIEPISYRKDYDSYYEEDNEDSEFCRFNCLFNLHEIYDRYLTGYATDLPNKTIYRVEKESGEGLYDGRFASIGVDIDRHPSPADDAAIGVFFKSDPASRNVKYQKKWSFGFSNIEDAKNWINDSNLIDKLKEDGYVLKEFTLPSNFIIEGFKQTIFQKKYTIKEESFDLDLVKNNKKLSI